MIGIICRETEKETVKEFFELFKTPWEFYLDCKSYDVVLSTKDDKLDFRAKLVFLFGSTKNRFDELNGVRVRSLKKVANLACHKKFFPLYGNFLTFEAKKNKVITVNGSSEAVGLEITVKNKKFLRIGYDLFQEIDFLLTSGQPSEYSHIPTLDIHISVLRELIVASGVALIEIPPVPKGYDFISCLTHDVDFISLRRHQFDHTMFGFLYRALVGSLIDSMKKKCSWRKVSRNWIALAKLPGVYIGIVKDYFDQFDRYLEIEEKLPSTFFLIPYKNYAGENGSRTAPRKRACQYKVSEIETTIQKLASKGCEIGLHSIDAWTDYNKARNEYKKLYDILPSPKLGTRVHWLYFNSHSPDILDKAGFFYDSTCGYNDSVGYKAGTTQAFCPPGAKKLLELPLHIQDTALFLHGRMNLSEPDAWKKVAVILDNAKKTGGALTINWHLRSLGPERLWDDFYVQLLNQLKQRNVWFARAGDAVNWFAKRRSVHFENIKLEGDLLSLEYRGYQADDLPALVFRVHRPDKRHVGADLSPQTNENFIDIPLPDSSEIEILL